MINFKQVETSEGPKTLLVTCQEQRDYAKTVDKDSVYCLLPYLDGWFVEMVIDNIKEADLWWESKRGPARVYYGQSGALRHSK